VAYLALRQLAKSYDGVTRAVDGISIDVDKGEFVTFLGPSGSGKTTTLVMVAGFEAPTSGEILLAGKDLTRLKPWDRNIGMVFQNYALFPHMTVARNVSFPLRMRRVTKAEMARRVREVLALVGLETFAERYPRELSGGQQQRVAIARALVSRPTVLFADEPTGNLDSATGSEILTLMRDSVDSYGQTTVMVTHEPRAAAIADRILFLADGQIVSDVAGATQAEILETLNEIAAA